MKTAADLGVLGRSPGQRANNTFPQRRRVTYQPPKTSRGKLPVAQHVSTRSADVWGTDQGRLRTFRALFAHEVGRRGSWLSKPIGGPRQTEGMAEEAFPGELWDIDQLAAHLKTSKDFVYTLTAQRRIGFLRVGKFIRFAPEHVRDYLNSIAVPRK